MLTPTEFWLAVHRLAEAYSSEGLVDDERIVNIVADFKEMPLIARRQVLADLGLIAARLPDVYVAVAPVAIRAEEADRHAKERGAG